jgi:hypothetical protein
MKSRALRWACSRSVLFLVDTSGSTAGTKIDGAWMAVVDLAEELAADLVADVHDGCGRRSRRIHGHTRQRR